MIQTREPSGYTADPHMKYGGGGIASAQISGAGQAQRSSSYAHRAPASSNGPHHSSQRVNH